MRRISCEWSFWSGLALFLWMALMPWFSQTSAGDSTSVKIVKTSPTYAEEINNLKTLVITIQFNREMDPVMQEDFVMDQRGATDEQGNPIEIQGELALPIWWERVRRDSRARINWRGAGMRSRSSRPLPNPAG